MNKHFSFLLLLLSILLFLLLKLTHLSIRLSDTNVYFYTAYSLLNQQFLYKDILFTNLPLFPYISSIYQLLTIGNLKMFYATALVEVIIITSIIFFVVYKKTKNNLMSLLSSLLYMFSNLVLVTSDHQTGVFTASIFTLLAYFFLERKNFITSGSLVGLSLLTKAYFLPIVISFIIYLIFVKKNYRHFFLFLAGFIIFSIIVLMPFIILAQKEFITDVFYSVTREGIAKPDVIAYFIGYDFILFSILVFNLFNSKKNIFFALMSFTSIFFIIFYQGLYNVYLNFVIPFLAISFYNLSNFLTSRSPTLKIALPIILLFIIVINITLYARHFSNNYKVEGIDSIIELIKKENPKYLYGTTDITPALSYLSDVPLLDNIIDTNPNIFRKGLLDSKKLTQKAVDLRTIVIVRGPDDKLGIANLPINEVFDKNLLKKHCNALSGFPINTKSNVNSIILLKCY